MKRQPRLSLYLIQFCFSREVQTNLPRAQDHWTKKQKINWDDKIKYWNSGFETDPIKSREIQQNKDT